MNCGICGEKIKKGEGCSCPGSQYCTCEFYHHHAGCCENYGDVIEHIEHDHGLDLNLDPWAPIAFVSMPVLNAHDEYSKVV